MSTPDRLPPIPRSVVRAALIGFLPLLLCLPSIAESDAARISPQTLDRIQRQCLQAYPADLLAAMASGAEAIPPEVDEDPEAQMQFLDKEVPLDKGLFYPILLEDMLPAFERYVSAGTRFLDLGSGDGRVLFLANVLGAHAVGIEYDKKMVKITRKARKSLSDLLDSDRLEVIRGDFFESSWSGYDVIYYFDLSSFEQDRVREKLQRELDPGARLIVGFQQAPFPGLELEARFPERDERHPVITIFHQPMKAPAVTTER